MTTKTTITNRTEGFVQFSNGFIAERIVTKMTRRTVWICRYPEGATAASFVSYKEAADFCRNK